MKARKSLLVIVFAVGCLTGAGWALSHLKVPNGPGLLLHQAAVRDSQTLRLAGVLAPVATVPIRAVVVELEVPLDSWVRKGQIIGESEGRDDPGATTGGEAGRSLADAEAAVTAARSRLIAINAKIAEMRGEVVDQEYKLVAAGTAEIETEESNQRSERLYRQGMEGELERDQSSATRQAALQQADRSRSVANLSAGNLDVLELSRLNALSDLREARERQRIAEAAVPRREEARAVAPVVAPADGLLVKDEDCPGKFEIVPDWRHLIIETAVGLDQLPYLRPGQSAIVSLSGQQGATFRATVDTIGEAVAAGSGTVQIPVSLSVEDSSGVPLHRREVTIAIRQTANSVQ